MACDGARTNASITTAGMTEFELIRAYFSAQPVLRDDVSVGIGDDAALVRAAPGMEIAVSTDVLVAGIHFFSDADPFGIGHKCLAVNLSDLAAMGAEPAWFLLDLTLPRVDTAWLQRFSEGLYSVAQAHRMQLIGGDTSRGPLSIAITAMGEVPQGKSLLRAGASVGDIIYVTGALGDAAAALAALSGRCVFPAPEIAAARVRLERPVPRVAEGIMLRDLASSAIDVSDGLLADLGHVLEASRVGARVDLEALPLSPFYRAHLRELGWDYALAGGDDYELCFTVPAGKLGAVAALSHRTRVPLTAIGTITSNRGLDVRNAAGEPYHPSRSGHDHFEVV